MLDARSQYPPTMSKVVIYVMMHSVKLHLMRAGHCSLHEQNCATEQFKLRIANATLVNSYKTPTHANHMKVIAQMGLIKTYTG